MAGCWHSDPTSGRYSDPTLLSGSLLADATGHHLRVLVRIGDLYQDLEEKG